MKKISTQAITIVAFGVALNYVGGTIALALRLPIYLDSIGTIFSAVFLGPAAGVSTGILSALLSGITTDLFALYYAPVQIVTGLCAGIFLKGNLEKKKVPLLTAFVSVPGTLVASGITVYLFQGITSSGSSIIVQLLSGLGIPLGWCVILVQLGTDYFDRLLSIILIATVWQQIKQRKPRS